MSGTGVFCSTPGGGGGGVGRGGSCGGGSGGSWERGKGSGRVGGVSPTGGVKVRGFGARADFGDARNDETIYSPVRRSYSVLSSWLMP